MDRLTATIKLPPEGVFISYTEEQLEEIKQAEKVPSREIYRRLQAYEDTGLTPVEVAVMKVNNKRLNDLIDIIKGVIKAL